MRTERPIRSLINVGFSIPFLVGHREVRCIEGDVSQPRNTVSAPTFDEADRSICKQIRRGDSFVIKRGIVVVQVVLHAGVMAVVNSLSGRVFDELIKSPIEAV